MEAEAEAEITKSMEAEAVKAKSMKAEAEAVKNLPLPLLPLSWNFCLLTPFFGDIFSRDEATL